MLVGTLNQEKSLVRAFSVIVKLCVIFGNLRLKLYWVGVLSRQQIRSIIAIFWLLTPDGAVKLEPAAQTGSQPDVGDIYSIFRRYLDNGDIHIHSIIQTWHWSFQTLYPVSATGELSLLSLVTLFNKISIHWIFVITVDLSDVKLYLIIKLKSVESG